MIIFLIFLSSLWPATNDFINENLKSFTEFSLSNGIPVFIKQNKQSNTKAVVLVIKGGALNATPDKAGMEKAAIATALYESKKYSNTDKIKLLKDTSAGISSAVDFTETTYSVNSLNKYFDEVFDLYTDLLINPTFKKEYFDEVITELKNDYRSRMSDGYARVMEAFTKKFLYNHPYSANQPNLTTLDSFTREELAQYYKEHITASRMLIFAAGDFDIEKFKAKLEASFGKLDKGKYSKPVIPKFDKNKELPVMLDPFSELRKDTSYVRCTMLAPNIKDKDYWPLAIAYDVFKDLGYDIIRGERSLVYSLFTLLKSAEANYSIVVGFKINDIWAFKKALDDTIKQVCRGTSSIKDEKNKYKKLSDTIDFYRLSYQTSYYEGLQTNASIASSMAESYIITGDYKFYLSVMDKINKITVKDIIIAANKYMLNTKKYCAVSANPEVIEEIKKKNPYGKRFEVVKF